MAERKDTVVLVHGLAANRLMMKPLESHLMHCGFKTLNWGYPSVRHDIEHHARSLRQELMSLERDRHVECIRLVTHSMGGIVARAAILAAHPAKLRSLVMLGPPNHGSRVAGMLSEWLSWCCKSLAQLAAAEDSFVNRLPPPEGLQLGIVAALFDRVVTVDSTRLRTALDHRVVPCGHNSMLFRRDVADYVSTFLRKGHFCAPSLARRSASQTTGPAAARSSMPSTLTADMPVRWPR